MQFEDWTNDAAADTSGGKFLTTDDTRAVVGLLRELRDITLSRASFAAIDALLARLADEEPLSRLVPADALDR